MPNASPHAFGRGALVLGMHRSGTSLVAGILDALGLPACVAEDRFPIRRWNARGNFESRSLTLFDDRLLNQLGGAWFAPPDPSPGWQDVDELEPFRAEAAELFAAAHPYGRWVWKDPRACVLLPFWDSVLGRGLPRVLVLRSPLESAASLEARNQMPLGIALAIVERSLHCALRDSAGQPVLITAYEDVLLDLESWCGLAAKFLDAHGLTLDKPLAIDKTRALLDPELRHHRGTASLDRESGASDALCSIWDWATGRQGIHDALSIDDLPGESRETAATLSGVARATEIGRGAGRSSPGAPE